MKLSAKPLLPLFLAVCLALFGGWLAWRSAACFDDVGPWWKGRVMDRYISTQGKVERVYVHPVIEAKRRTVVSQQIMIEGEFTANGKLVAFSGIDAVLHHNDKTKSAAVVEEIRRSRPETEVLYDPEFPQQHVLHRENLPGAVKVIFLGLLGVIIFIAGLGLVGLAGSFLLGQLLPVSMKLLQTSPSLTGDPKADFYSGALAAHARKHWRGEWCDVFLMPEQRIIILHDETDHHRAETCSLQDLLSGRVALRLTEEETEDYQQFLTRLREEMKSGGEVI